jgi:hypothetical protein
MIVAVTPSSRLGPGLALAMLVLLLPACGGSEDTVPTTSETATTAGNTRLSAASWDAYVQARDKAQAVNEQAIDQFQVCKKLAVRYTDTLTSKATACVDKAAAPVVTGGKALLQSLTALEAEVSGTCLTTLQQVEETTQAYVATVQSLQTALANGVDSTQLGPAVDDAKQALTSGRQDRVAFEAACKPKSSS